MIVNVLGDSELKVLSDEIIVNINCSSSNKIYSESINSCVGTLQAFINEICSCNIGLDENDFNTKSFSIREVRKDLKISYNTQQSSTLVLNNKIDEVEVVENLIKISSKFKASKPSIRVTPSISRELRKTKENELIIQAISDAINSVNEVFNGMKFRINKINFNPDKVCRDQIFRSAASLDSNSEEVFEDLDKELLKKLILPRNIKLRKEVEVIFEVN